MPGGRQAVPKKTPAVEGGGLLPQGRLRQVCISTPDALLQPVQDFLLDPTHPALAKLHPFGELAGRFKARNVLRAVEDQLFELAFR